MRESDKPAFSDLLTNVAAYYDRKLVTATMDIYWRGLIDLPIEAVRDALNAHVQDGTAGKFMPKIADIRAALQAAMGDGGHPGPDEAWSIALQARDESSSVVWTDQISTAFFAVAMPLLDEGDKIAARRAFLERYEREIADARKAGIRAEWRASLGSDPQQRTKAIEQAVQHKRITDEHAQRLLPRNEPITHDAMLAIENGVKAQATSADEARARTAALRALLRLPQ